ncbi:MAG: DoxX family protein [Alphaproteobacteria bacterium]|nr:DoxX family protein [Alphaproteobacteria bacterium]
MHKFLHRIDNAITPLRTFANFAGAPLLDLIIRLYLANDFFKSGITRFNDWKNASFDNQIFLFSAEHPVPFLPPEAAAYVTMSAELILPALLVVGLFGRAAAAGLLIMTAVIEFTYGHFDVHILWAFLAASILVRGPGALSLDTVLLKILRRVNTKNPAASTL